MDVLLEKDVFAALTNSAIHRPSRWTCLFCGCICSKKSIIEFDTEAWSRVFGTNLSGAMLVSSTPIRYSRPCGAEWLL